ncbi:site-specific DNA-methyltransferase [Candidatus Saccharibacteria bacterium]|nr:site-specific DNA-methyltransferase [Candidatus Saccharibacteria bacterium]MBR2994305.1 site-specific DNA-methyltransferase [Candidatus Saccharibacteria bacterium]MBR2995057.1 site-specific DNA-methyltransferase [Candidatus Saccharibacteria bacterium]
MYKTYNDDAYKILSTLINEKRKVDHIITDPPYNISQKNNFTTMNSAKRTGIDFGNWDKGFDLTSWIPLAASLLKSGGTFIVFNSYRNITPIITELENCGMVVKDIIKWIKSNPMPRNINRRYVQDTEFAIWAVKPKKPWVFNLPENAKYLRAEYKTPTVLGKERVGHPTQKSLKLMTDIIKVHTNPGDCVLDPFMGSGTTGVAAINLSRDFIGIEIDESYYKTALNRLERASHEH